VIYKCVTSKDSSVHVYSEYPPKLKISKTDLENLINESLRTNIPHSDSTIKLHVFIIINCDSTADYYFPLKGSNIPYSELGEKIIELLKQNCSWSPGKSIIEHTGNIPKRMNGKIVYQPQYTHWLVRYQVAIEFDIENYKIFIKSKINTI